MSERTNDEHIETLRILGAFVENWDWAAKEDSEFPEMEDIREALVAGMVALALEAGLLGDA